MDKNNEIYKRIEKQVEDTCKDKKEDILNYKNMIEIINVKYNAKTTCERLMYLKRDFKINHIEITSKALADILDVGVGVTHRSLKRAEISYNGQFDEKKEELLERNRLIGAEIKEYASKYTLKELGEITGYSTSKIAEACNYCYLDTKNTFLYDKNPLSDHEIRFIKGNRRKLYIEEIAEYLNRDKRSVEYHAKKNGVKLNYKPVGNNRLINEIQNKPHDLEIGNKYLITIDEGQAVVKDIYEVKSEYNNFYLLTRKSNGNILKTTLYKYDREAIISRLAS